MLEIPLAGADLLGRLAAEARLYLFLDYDGTLAEFSPTPDTVIPNPEVVRLVADLLAAPGVRVAVVSGRRLVHIDRLLPLTGLAVAGTYGLEIRSPQGEMLAKVGLDPYPIFIDRLKPALEDLLAGRAGFYLEDKGWTLAIHAREAGIEEAELVFERAKELAVDLGMPEGMHFLGGDRFLEISPLMAEKGLAVEEIYRRYPFPGALPVYLGDDDKDETGFRAVNELGGVSIVVAGASRPTEAGYRLPAPPQVRSWLRGLIERRNKMNGS